MEKHSLVLANRMRKAPTKAEKHLWKFLRGRRLSGHKFRRQHVIDRYIVDFALTQKKLIIELDGEVHFEQQEYDAIRTKYLSALGYTVLRFWNDDVLKNTDNVLKKIRAQIEIL